MAKSPSSNGRFQKKRIEDTQLVVHDALEDTVFLPSRFKDWMVNYLAVSGVNLPWGNISGLVTKVQSMIDDDVGSLTLDTIPGSLVEAQTPLTTKGDLLSTNGTTLTRTGVGANGLVLTADSAQTSGLAWVAPTVPAEVMEYSDTTSNVSITGTSVNTIVVGGSITYENELHLVEFWCSALQAGASGTLTITLRDSGTDMGVFDTMAASDVRRFVKCERYLTPSAGSHSYSIGAQNSVGQTSTMYADTGGAGNRMPAFMRITRLAT